MKCMKNVMQVIAEYNAELQTLCNYEHRRVKELRWNSSSNTLL